MNAAQRFKSYLFATILSFVCSIGLICPMSIQAKEQPTSFGEEQGIRKTLAQQDKLDEKILNPPAVYTDEADFEFVDQREIITTPTLAPYHSCVSLELVYSDSSSAFAYYGNAFICLLYTSPSPRD